MQVPGIKNELPKIVETLSKLDYTLVWITVSAETAAGVPMMRKRWFMFGYKNNITNINILQNLKLSPPSSVIFNSFNNNSIISEYACMVEFTFTGCLSTSFLSLFSSQRGKEEQRKEALQVPSTQITLKCFQEQSPQIYVL
jgi:site-specific DNA-cytosine methylase